MTVWQGEAESLHASAGTMRPMLRLALPVLGEEALTMLVGYTDWWLVGHFLGTTAHKAAMGLMAYALWLLPSLFAAVAIGATALVSRFVGGRDPAAASRVTNQAMLIGAAMAVVVTALAWAGGSTMIRVMQLEAEAARLAEIYLRIVIPAIPLLMIEQVGAACLRGAGDTISAFVAKSIVNLVNIAVSTSLILGLGPLPQLGWRGLAIGTATGHVVGGLLILLLLVRGRSSLQLRRCDLRPDTAVMRRILRIGLPGGLDVLAILACHMVYVAIINSLGTLAAAAHGLGVQIEAMAYLPGAAFMVAATTLSGQLLGAGRPEQAARSTLLTCMVACSVMTAAALAFFFLGGPLTTFFTGNPHDEAGRVTAELLKIVALSSPALGVLQVLSGGLRGAGDTRMPLVITFVGLLLYRIPMACYLAWDSFVIPGLDVTIEGWGLGVYGAWWAMTTDVILRAMLTAARFAQGGWKRIQV